MGWVIGGLIIAALIALIVVGIKQHLKRTASINAALAELTDFTASRQFVACDAHTAFAVDESRGRLALVTAGEPAMARVVPLADLLEAELVEDNLVIAKSARASRLRGVVMGGVDPLRDLRRPGELTMNRTINPVPPGKVREIVLRLTVNDAQQPLHAVNFMNSETERTNLTYTRIMTDARGWHVWFTAVLEQAELNEAAESSSLARVAGRGGSVADELQKLVQLHRDGVLNAAEFADQKARLLARD